MTRPIRPTAIARVPWWLMSRHTKRYVYSLQYTVDNMVRPNSDLDAFDRKVRS